MIQSCGGLAEVANLPPSIKTLDIFYCGNLRSLSGQLDALQTFTLFGSSSSLQSNSVFLSPSSSTSIQPPTSQ
jgi:hypothetical protein